MYEIIAMNAGINDKIKLFCDDLPPFCHPFLIDTGLELADTTRLAYAGELNRFFDYLISCTPFFCDKEKRSITLDDLKTITSQDITRYLSICKGMQNKERTIARKRAALSSFFTYLTDNRLIEYNPVRAAQRVKIPKSDTVIHIDMKDQVKLLNMIDTGDCLDDKKKKYHDRYKLRDYALVLLLLDTGIRVSELQGINIIDINYDNSSVQVIRKGGDAQTIYFSDEVGDVLSEYIEARRVKNPALAPTDPLFVSLKGQRLTVRAIEKLVKKYTEAALPGIGQKLSPHKMRSSFAMQFYAAEKDILALQGKLGHKNLTATNIYAKATDAKMKETRSVISNVRDQERANQKQKNIRY